MNAIRLVQDGPWHVWFYGNMMPLCGAGVKDPVNDWPEHFVCSTTPYSDEYPSLEDFCDACLKKTRKEKDKHGHEGDTKTTHDE